MARCQPLRSLRVLSVEVNATPPPLTYRPVLGALRRVEKCSPASGGARLLRLTTPSSLRSFDPAPPCRAASPSPHIAVIPPLSLINPRRGRAVACECIKIHPADFVTHASHLPPDALNPWGRLCIFRSERKGRAEKKRQGGGGCAMPLRGQAPVTPNSLILHSLAISTHYKLE